MESEKPTEAEFAALGDERSCALAMKLDGTIWPYDSPELVAHEPPLEQCELGKDKCTCVLLYFWP